MLHFPSLTKFLDHFKKKKSGDDDNVKLNSSLPLLHSEITHTRIPGDSTSGIFGGAYCIPPEAMDEFYHHYYHHCFVEKLPEYLTEKPYENESPILIDLDLKFEKDDDKRVYTEEDIFNIIFLLYLERLKEILQFDDGTSFQIYVFEKPFPVQQNGVLKDGIHILIGMKLNRSLQLVLRQHVVDNIGSMITWPISNEWGTVVDEAVTRGSSNWQLYGSKKPTSTTSYQLTYYFNVTFDKTDNEFQSEKVTDFTWSKELLIKLSARNTTFPCYPMHQRYQQAGSIRSHSKLAGCNSIPFTSSAVSSSSSSYLNVSHITTMAILDEEIEKFLNSLNLTTQYNIKEAHEYAIILPEKYFQPGSHIHNIKLAFALKNTDFRLFLTWVKVRSKASDFDFSTVDALYLKWCNHLNQGDYDFKGLTKRSIVFWAKEENPQQFYEVRKSSTDYYIECSLNSGLDYDFAFTIYQMYKDEYVCANLAGKPVWYHFENHRWVKDKSNSLRLKISNTFYDMYAEKLRQYMRKIFTLESKPDKEKKDDEELEKLKNQLKIGEKNIKKLKQCSDKNNIYKELAEIFYDKEFLVKMDKNKYLICFNNGVVDMKNKIFRQGYPDDYNTKSTGIDYTPLEEWKCTHPEIFDSVNDFFEKVFPIENIREYMYDHLASCLIGQNLNQTFTIYCGRGSNGKSLLTDFMALALGEYFGTVPVTLVTDKRTSVGSTTSELMQLKGVRYAVMQEPSKDAKINEGMMKQLTGDSHMQARELYQESETFTIQFNLVVSLNELFKICSNDNGTWRRICVVNFVSKFESEDDVSYNALVESPSLSSDISTEPERFVFRKDPTLKDKLPLWAPLFASMLVARVFETEGIVRKVKEVTEASDKYRREQDAIAQYIKERLLVKEGESVKISEVKKSFGKFMKDNFLTGTSAKECADFMSQKFKLSPDKKSYLHVTILPETSSYAVEAPPPESLHP
jgi:P4 family phage/plasmid primase-like protien